jgi:hypothetical protein
MNLPAYKGSWLIAGVLSFGLVMVSGCSEKTESDATSASTEESDAKSSPAASADPGPSDEAPEQGPEEQP